MNIEERVKGILLELSGKENIDNEAMLQDDLMLDSLSMVTLLIEIEDTFEIQLDESDMNPFDLNMVQDVIDMVSRYSGDENE